MISGFPWLGMNWKQVSGQWEGGVAKKIWKQAYVDQVLLCSGPFALEVVVWYLGF